MAVLQLDINGNPFIGVWCAANNDVAFVPSNTTKSNIRKIQKVLDVQVVKLTIGGTNLIGSLTAINSKGIVVTNFIHENELKILEAHLKVGILKDKLNAAGNIILANDSAALVHPELTSSQVEMIQDVLEVSVRKGTIAELKTVGAAAVVTNKGLLCHPKVSKLEKKELEDHFKVPVDIGTANYGAPLIGACLIGNERGAVVGFTSTGIELGRIESGLNIIK
ncbi:MAG: translation initiation factor IF-6 [Thermoplasmata archaeon]|nr:MAG: translation initiation factor IF-6 [Thermoplasmata archaeon]